MANINVIAKNTMTKFGIFISDASFDHKTHVSVVAIKEMTEGQEWQEVIKDVHSPTEAEKRGIHKAMSIAYKSKYNNCVFICDNKIAVKEVRQEVFREDGLRTRFWFIQFLWLPRKFVYAVDHLTKNVSNELASEIKDHKEKSLIAYQQRFCKRELNNYINDVRPDKNYGQKALDKIIKQFTCLKEDRIFKSVLFNKIETISQEDMEFLLFNEIEQIEEDIQKTDDDILKIVMKSILDHLLIL